MLLLGALVAAHSGSQSLLQKELPPLLVKANGIEIGAGLEVEIELVVAANIAVEIVDMFGKV